MNDIYDIVNWELLASETEVIPRDIDALLE